MSRKKRNQIDPDLTIDLHGLTISEAENVVEDELDQLIKIPGRKWRIRIVTGKGIHSNRAGGNGTLSRAVHDFVQNRYFSQIVSIQDSPADVLLGDLPIRGHFDVVLKS